GVVQHLNLKQVLWIIDFADRPEKALNDVNFVENRQLHRDLWQGDKMAGRLRFVLPVFQEQVDDDIPMDAVRGEAEEDGQITDRPNKIARASLHKACRRRWPSQRGRHDAASVACVKSKIPRLPREIATFQ